MSHVTDLKLVVRDLDALDQACETLGLELQRDKKSFAWWGRFVGDSQSYGKMTPEKMGRCDHAIKVIGTKPANGSGGPWEIGVVAEDGGYGLYYDTFGSAGGALTEKVGLQANRLRQEYAATVASKKALATLSRHGWRLSRETLPSGQIKLKVRR